MNWSQSNAELVIKHMKETTGWNMSLDKWLSLSPYEKVVAQFDAWAYFGEHRHYLTLEKVPEECKDGQMIYIREFDKRIQYRWKDGWIKVAELPDSLYK